MPLTFQVCDTPITLLVRRERVHAWGARGGIWWVARNRGLGSIHAIDKTRSALESKVLAWWPNATFVRIPDSTDRVHFEREDDLCR